MKVLITGFGPFPGAPVNPSGPLALSLARLRRPAFAAVSRVAHVFATSYLGVNRDLPALLAHHRPDIVLLFGLATRTPFLRIETRAQNAASVLSPDVDGRTAATGEIAPGAPASLQSRAPAHRLLAAARGAGVPARLSRDAGRYLCNYTYWRALAASRSGTLVQFVHIPSLVHVHRTGLVRAGEAILRVLIAARRR